MISDEAMLQAITRWDVIWKPPGGSAVERAAVWLTVIGDMEEAVFKKASESVEKALSKYPTPSDIQWASRSVPPEHRLYVPPSLPGGPPATKEQVKELLASMQEGPRRMLEMVLWGREQNRGATGRARLFASRENRRTRDEDFDQPDDKGWDDAEAQGVSGTATASDCIGGQDEYDPFED